MLCKSGDYEAEGWLGPEELNRKMMSGSPGFFPCQITIAAAHSKEIEHKGQKRHAAGNTQAGQLGSAFSLSQ
jgi:hypothetical protein